jgi:hypothetical protein
MSERVSAESGHRVAEYLKVRLLDLHPDLCFDAGKRHVEAVFDWHRLRVGKSWVLQLLVHLGNQAVADFRPRAILGLFISSTRRRYS